MAIVGVVKVAPVPNTVPPVDPAYHFTTPPELEAPRVTVEVPQLVAGTLDVIVGFGVTVMVIGLVK